MYNNKYVTELSISEVKEYYEKLRENRKVSYEWNTDFGICKERLIEYAYKNIDVLDKIRAEIEQECKVESEHPYGQGLRRALDIIEKYRGESEE